MPTTLYQLLHLFLLLLLHIVPADSFVTTCYRLLPTKYFFLTPYRLLTADTVLWLLHTYSLLRTSTHFYIYSTSSKYSPGRQLFAYYFRPTTEWLLLLTDYSIPNTPYRILPTRYFLLPILHLHSLLLLHIHRVRPAEYTLTRPLPYFYFYVYSVPTTSCWLLPPNYSTPNRYPLSLPLHDPSIKFVSKKKLMFFTSFLVILSSLIW